MTVSECATGSSEMLLLDELTHRVHNHLQHVCILLDDARHAPKSLRERELNKVFGQVSAVAGLYRLLAQTPTITLIEAGRYINALCKSLFAVFMTRQGIELRLALTEGLLPSETCRYLGLIITELVGNAAEHAFKGRDIGEIYLKLEFTESTYSLVVADNGCGFSRNVAERCFEAKSTGLTIVRGLAQSLEGACLVETGPLGTKISMQFSLRPGS